MVGFVHAAGLLLTLGAAPEAAATPAFSASWQPVARPILPVVIVLPRGGYSSFDASDLITGLDRLLQRHTRFKARFIDLDSVDECLASSQGGAFSNRGTYECLVMLCGDQRPALPIALIASAKRDAFKVLTVGILQFGEALRRTDIPPDQREQEIVSRFLSISKPIQWKNPATSSRMDTEIVARVRPLFDDLPPALNPQLRVNTAAPSTVIVELPGTRGTLRWAEQKRRVEAQVTAIELSDLPATPTSLRLNFEGYPLVETQVLPQAGQRLLVSPVWRPLGRGLARNVLWYSGLAGAAAGLALGTYAVVTPQTEILCFSPTDGACGDPLNPDRSSRDLNPLLPLGSGLVVLGTAWALGSWLEDTDGMPWWSFVIGLAGMAASVGVAALAEQ